MFTTLGSEHWMSAEDVARLRKQRHHGRLCVDLHREHVYDEHLLGRAALRPHQLLDQLAHHGLETQDAHRNDEDVQPLIQKLGQRPAPYDTISCSSLRVVGPAAREDVEVRGQLLADELAEVAEAHDAHAHLAVAAVLRGRHLEAGPEVLQAGHDAAAGVAAEDPEEGRHLLQVPDGIGRVGLVQVCEKVDVEQVAVLGLAADSGALPLRRRR
mmetsp:Transcript_80151/g.235762  ORF Transcript_80151/g.235762 Transcript_80151/m.235762 type:complete len:213 (+) Transcript_80151:472-1110(+)